MVNKQQYVFYRVILVLTALWSSTAQGEKYILDKTRIMCRVDQILIRLNTMPCRIYELL
jgi:hypothetical protein